MKTTIHHCGKHFRIGAALVINLLVMLPLLITSGCVTPYAETEAAAGQMRLRNEVSNLRESVERLQNRLEAVQEEQEHQAREHHRLRDNMQRVQNDELAHLRQATDERFNALQQQREKDRQTIIEQVTQRIAGHLEQVTERKLAATQAERSEYGRYHEVRAGETLSEIAAAYDARVNAIVQANEIENPDRLRIGQRLFIPD